MTLEEREINVHVDVKKKNNMKNWRRRSHIKKSSKNLHIISLNLFLSDKLYTQG